MPRASAPLVALSRLTRILLLVAVALCLGAPAAGAVPAKKLDNNLEAMWKTILQTPAPNPILTTGGCFDLGGTVAPFGLDGFTGTCTVKPGTKIFVAAASAECSTLKGDDNPPPPGTEAQLQACALGKEKVQQAPSVTVDGKFVPVAEVYTPLLNITLPAGNIFGLDPGTTGQSVAHGWVTLLHPLTPGNHEIHIVSTEADIDITTTITVQPGLKP